LVGDYAWAHGKTKRGAMSELRFSDDEIVQVLAFTALGLISKRTGVTNFRVVTGLPLTHYATQKDKIRKALVGVHQFSLGGKDRTIAIEMNTLSVMRCTIGQWWDYAADVDGNIVKREPYQVFVDVGTGTTDFSGIRGSDAEEPSPVLVRDGSESMPEGWASVTKKIADQLIPFGVTAGHYEIDHAVRNGKKLGSIDISEYAEQAIKEFARKIADTATSFYGNGLTVNVMVLSGGPSETLAPVFKSLYPQANVVVPSDPMFSLARGYAKWGKSVAYGN
jgi:hypothetical protein